MGRHAEPLPPSWEKVKAIRGRPVNEATIAELLGVSRGRVSQLLQRAIRKLFRRSAVRALWE